MGMVVRYNAEYIERFGQYVYEAVLQHVIRRDMWAAQVVANDEQEARLKLIDRSNGKAVVVMINKVGTV